MNESTNNQAPKKSFWAKLFGGKDNTSSAQPTTQPTPVPPTDPATSPVSDTLTATPPASELGDSPSSEAPQPEAVSPLPPAPTVEVSSTPSFENATTPASPATEAFPSAESPVAPPPTDPMVTPLSSPRSSVDLQVPASGAPGVTEQPPVSSWDSSDISEQQTAPTLETPGVPTQSVNELGSESTESPVQNPIPSDEGPENTPASNAQ